MMMTRKKSFADKYWDWMKQKQIREEYETYLREEDQQPGPDSAHLFAIKMISGGHDYHGLDERDLICLLSGELPYMYD
jgi:hypothetical protein